LRPHCYCFGLTSAEQDTSQSLVSDNDATNDQTRLRNSLHLMVLARSDRLCGLVVRVLGYRSGGPGSIPGTTGGGGL
jgi:hypothetical protein